MTIAISPLAEAGALKAADRELGANRVWSPTSEVQREWLKLNYADVASDLALVREIETNATRDAANHIAFLAKHGWKAQILNVPPGGFLTAAVLDILVEWLCEGTRTTITAQNRETYAGFKLKAEPGADNVQFFRHAGLGTLLFKLATKSGDFVFITESPRAPIDSVDLMHLVNQIPDTTQYSVARGKEVAIPMVDLNSKTSLDWIVGLNTVTDEGHSYSVSEAVQQATLKMNQAGARARAAVEMGMRCTSFEQPMLAVVDKPFLFVIVRPGVSQPIFAAYVDYDSWKDPGNLDK